MGSESLALDLHLFESQNCIHCSVALGHIFSLEFFSPFGVYMNWLNPSHVSPCLYLQKRCLGKLCL